MTRILLTGKAGQVGWELERALAPLGNLIAPGRGEMDLAAPDSIRAAIRAARPGLIVNAAGYTTVDKAESEPDIAMRINAAAPGIIAEEARRLNAPLVHYSTDYVYDGEQQRPYTEDDPPNPVNAYGKSKLAGERAIQAAGGAHLILRTSWVYSARRSNFVLAVLRLARERPELPIVNDQIGSPSWARALATATLELLRQRERIRAESGIYHLAAEGYASRYEFAAAILRIMRERPGESEDWATLKPVTTAQYGRLPAARPPHPVTAKDKVKRVFGVSLPGWEAQLRAFLALLPPARP